MKQLVSMAIDSRTPEWCLFFTIAAASCYLTFNFAESMGTVFVAVLLAAEGSKYVIRSRLNTAINDNEGWAVTGWMIAMVAMIALSLVASAAGLMEFSAAKDSYAHQRFEIEKQESVIREQIASIDNQLKPLLETIAVYNRADKATVGSAPLLPKVEKLESDKQRLLKELAALPVIPAPKLNALDHTVAKVAEMTGKTINQAWWCVSMMVAVLVEFLCLILFPTAPNTEKQEIDQTEPHQPKPTTPALSHEVTPVTQQPAILVAKVKKIREVKKEVPEQLGFDTETILSIPAPKYAALIDEIKKGEVRPVKAEIRKAARVGAREVPGIVEQLINDGVLMMKGKRLALA